MIADIVAVVVVAALAIASVYVATVLFHRWRRNQFRFSIRAMLLSFVASGCALFVIVHWLVPMVAHRWAIQNIYVSGGAVLFRSDYQQDSGSIYSDPSKGNPWRGVSILHARSDAEAIAISRVLRHLPEADCLFVGSRVTDAGLKALSENAGYSSIDTVNLLQSPVTGDGLMYFANFERLRLMFLNTCPIRDADLAALKSLPALRNLTLLEEGSTANSKRFTEAGFRELGQLKQLEKLWLVKLEVSNDSADQLKKLTGLKKLQLSRCQISDDAILELQQALPHCEVVVHKIEPSAPLKE